MSRFSTEILTVPCVAGVLVGGRSRRMGQAKPLLPHPHGGTFVEYVVAVAKAVADDVVLLGDTTRVPARLTGLPVLADVVPDAGPLGGLGALLEYAGARWSLLLACDLPRVERTLLAKLVAHTDQRYAAVAFCQGTMGGEYHACCAAYGPAALPAVRAQLARRDYRLQNLLASLPIVALPISATEAAQLANVNSPEDLAKLASATWPEQHPDDLQLG